VLLVDDEPDILELLELTLSRMGLRTTTAADLAEARRALLVDDFSFCLTDMRLPDGNGMDLVREIAAGHPDLPVAVITRISLPFAFRTHFFSRPRGVTKKPSPR
jgi:two-component system response regulator PilR (NtrC family)